MGEKLHKILFAQGEIDLRIIKQLAEPASGARRELSPIRPFIEGSPTIIQARRVAQGVKELPLGEKPAQQKQPGMNHRTTVKNKASQQKHKIAEEERDVQRQANKPFM